jgi:ABC-type lipoprotein release transport system permease subunit
MDALLSAAIGLLLLALAVYPAVRTYMRHPLLKQVAVMSIRGHLRQGLMVALTAAVATSVVAGALVVGDSMQELVEATATEALPDIDAALRMSSPLNSTYFATPLRKPEVTHNFSQTAFLLSVPAATTCDRTGQRDGQVNLFGIEPSIYEFAQFRQFGDWRTVAFYSGDVAINRHLADEVGAKTGDRITVRVPNPGFWGDFLFLFGEDASVSKTFSVKAIVDDEGLGRLDLEARRTPTSAVFMSLDEAQTFLGLGNEVNTIALQYKDREIVGTDEEEKVLEGLEALLDTWMDSDSISLRLHDSPLDGGTLVSDHVFLDPDLEPRLAEQAAAWSPTMTYFVDSLQGPGTEDLAYSVVTGIDFDADRAAFGEWAWNASSPRTEPRPGTRDALINNWTAEHLSVGPGDTIHVGFTVVDERFRLEERSVDLTVVGVVDIAGKAADPSLLPPIPGINDAVSCLDWEPPFPLDLGTIEDEDVAYWHQYTGTPKVWVDLGTARELWTNPDGDWTGARFKPAGDGAVPSLDAFDAAITASDAGVAFIPIRADALATAGPLAIFEQMFIAFGVVLIITGLLLQASAFANLARARRREHSTLRALGMTQDELTRLMVLEGTLWALLAGAFGLVAGVALGAGLVGGLNSFWASAVESAKIPLAVGGGSLALAFGVGLVVTITTLFLSARQAARAELAATLADREGGGFEMPLPGTPKRWLALGLVLLILPGVAGAALRPGTDVGGLAMFFTVGLLATLGWLLVMMPFMPKLEQQVRRRGLTAPLWLGLRSLRRRPRRALALITTFAVVAFSVIGISWAGEMEIRTAGDFKSEQTGGYDVLAETWVQVGTDLKDDPDAPPGDWKVTPVKVVGHQGGTCSNLNARFPPRVMGVPDEFLGNVTVGFRSSDVGGDRSTWLSLDELTSEGRVPVVVDYNTLVWIYGGELGEVYEVSGDRGRVHELEVVGVMENSIFAGSFVTGLSMVERVYPDSSAYTYFLFEAGSAEPEELVSDLEVAFADLGLDARTTVDQIKENLGYELSFLRLFQAYLALGLVVGAVGLGAIAIRQVGERRREIGSMGALGWPRLKMGGTFLAEELWIAVAGLVAGLLGAAVSVVTTTPSWLGSLDELYFPIGSVGSIAAAVVLSAGFAALLAAYFATRVPVADALKSVE